MDSAGPTLAFLGFTGAAGYSETSFGSSQSEPLIEDIGGLEGDAGAGTAPFQILVDTQGMIAYYSARDGNMEIYSMNVDGAEQKNLTNHWVEEV